MFIIFVIIPSKNICSILFLNSFDIVEIKVFKLNLWNDFKILKWKINI